MKSNDWKDDFITIRGKNIPIKTGEIELSKLFFYAENPRIYSLVRSDKHEPSQDDILQALLQMDHVKELVQDIKENGGLMDPIIVRLGTFDVLEGNSRLAAYKFLCEKDPIKWGKIKGHFLPEDIDDEYVFALLGQYHIKGKKDWAPYEQAGFLYRRYKKQGAQVSKIGDDLGLGRTRVAQLIETYEFMQNHNHRDIKDWSYCEELIKSTKIKKVREKHPGFDKKFSNDVKSGDIGRRALDVRESIQKIAVGSDRIISKYVEGMISLEDACEKIEDSGNSDTTYRRISTFRNWLASNATQEEILSSPKVLKNKFSFELEKLEMACERLKKGLKK